MKSLDYLQVAERAINQISDKGAFLVVKSGNKINPVRDSAIKDGEISNGVNVMTIGWALIGFLWRKPMMMVVVRDTRYTFGLIEQADSFSVNIPSRDMKKELEFCGTKSGRNIDKFKERNLKTLKAQKISSPILDIPAIHYECKIVYKSAMNPQFLTPKYVHLYPNQDYHTMYFGEIQACYRTE